MTSWGGRLKLANDLLVINALGVILILAIVFSPDSVVRVVLGLPFVLFFPGYALICALFPKKSDLGAIERMALSIGLSIAVVPLIGLVLNYTPFGIQLYPILGSLFFFTSILSLMATYARSRISVTDRFAPAFSVPRRGTLSKTNVMLSVVLIVALMISGGVAAALVGGPKDPFSEFYYLGPEGSAADYPTNLTLGDSGTVILVVVNHEYQEVNYNIAIKLDNESIGMIENVVLVHEDRWEREFIFTPEEAGGKMKLEFLLFRQDADDPYRSLQLWIYVRLEE